MLNNCAHVLRSYFVALGVCAIVVGCGTVGNAIWRGPLVYGGIRLDAGFVRDASEPGRKIFGVVDFPFSLVGDTVFLPITVPYTLIKKKRCAGIYPPTDYCIPFSDSSGGIDPVERKDQ